MNRRPTLTPGPTPGQAPDDPPYAEPAENERETESPTRAVAGVLREFGPWSVSLAAHLAVVILAMLLVVTTMVAGDPEPRPIALRPVAQRTSEPLRQSDALSFQTQQRPAQVASPQPEPSPAPVIPDAREMPDLIGIGSPDRKADLLSTVTGDGGGDLFVPPVGPPGGPSARRIVFVIDASGSLIGDLGYVVNELRKTIDDLQAEQSFSVIFFQRGFALEAPPAGLKPATDAVKRDTLNWIALDAGHIEPGGTSNPLRALRLAFSYKPDLLYVLSDNITGSGRYELDREQLLAEVRSLNARAGAAIHTIQFVYKDPDATLEAISREHGGVHRQVSDQQVRHAGGG